MNNTELFVNTTKEILRFDFLNVFMASEIISTALKQVEKVMESQTAFVIEKEYGAAPTDDHEYADMLDEVVASEKYAFDVHLAGTESGFNYFLFAFEGTKILKVDVVRVEFVGEDWIIGVGYVNLDEAKKYLAELLN